MANFGVNSAYGFGSAGSGGGGGNAQKQPELYIVGTTPDAPIAGELTWTLPAFENSWIGSLLVNNQPVYLEDVGDGSMYLTKLLGSDTLTISNYAGGWVDGDKLQFILITP